MALQRLEIRYQSGTIAGYPIDSSKLALAQNDYIQDTYVKSMKPGVAVTFGAEGYIKPAGKADDIIIGYLVNDIAGYANQNISTIASGYASVLIGGANVFITDNVADADITAGTKLFVNADGLLTKTEGDRKGAVAIALSANSASNKALLVQNF